MNSAISAHTTHSMLPESEENQCRLNITMLMIHGDMSHNMMAFLHCGKSLHTCRLVWFFWLAVGAREYHSVYSNRDICWHI